MANWVYPPLIHTIRFLPVILCCWLAVTAYASALAAYKVVLKDGRIIEAKSKPVSMEGQFRFTSTDNIFHALPVSAVDLQATEAANPSKTGTKRANRMITNEDLKAGKKEPSSTGENSSGVKQIQPAENSEERGSSKTERRDEAYWRNRSKKLRDQIAALDSEINKINEKMKSGKSDGIQIGFGTYNQYMIADFEDQAKTLEKEKQKLLKWMTELEEEARRAGALPGWLR